MRSHRLENVSDTHGERSTLNVLQREEVGVCEFMCLIRCYDRSASRTGGRTAGCTSQRAALFFYFSKFEKSILCTYYSHFLGSPA